MSCLICWICCLFLPRPNLISVSFLTCSSNHLSIWCCLMPCRSETRPLQHVSSFWTSGMIQGVTRLPLPLAVLKTCLKQLADAMSKRPTCNLLLQKGQEYLGCDEVYDANNNWEVGAEWPGRGWPLFGKPEAVVWIDPTNIDLGQSFNTWPCLTENSCPFFIFWNFVRSVAVQILDESVSDSDSTSGPSVATFQSSTRRAAHSSSEPWQNANTASEGRYSSSSSPYCIRIWLTTSL